MTAPADISPATKEIHDKYKKYIRGGFEGLPIAITKTKGWKLTDIDGKEYIDGFSQYAVANLGYSHPEVVESTIDAILNYSMTNTAYLNRSYAELGEMIHNIFGYDSINLMLSGSDANDNAMKIAFKHGILKKKIPRDKCFILSASECYHGLTLGTHPLSSQYEHLEYLTQQSTMLANVGPVSPSGIYVKYGEFESLKQAIEKDHEVISAFIVEPIQGSAGIIDPIEPDYIKKAFDLCKKYDILFIADEVQTGLGRTGTLLRSDYYGIKPDIVCLGKGICSGLQPMSLVMGTKEVMDIIEFDEMGSTMAGNPPATNAAVATLKVITRDNIPQMAKKKGELMRKLIAEERLVEDGYISQVSGAGMLSALVLNDAKINEKYNSKRIAALSSRNGFMVNKAGYGKRVRVCPPVVISEEDLTKGIKILAESIRTVENYEIGEIYGF